MKCITYFLLTSAGLSVVHTFGITSQSPRSSRRERSLLLAAVETGTGSDNDNIGPLVSSMNDAIQACQSELTKTCKVKAALSSHRIGLIATEDIKKGSVIINFPYNGQMQLTPKETRENVFAGVLEKDYEGWTGDTGLIALQLLNELARMGGKGMDLPKRSGELQAVMDAWLMALPRGRKSLDHPLLWSEEDQEVLQASSNTKIYRVLDDLEEDATWLNDNVFEKDRTSFPPVVQMDDGGEEMPCFSNEGYKWAMAVVQSRAVFVDGSLRLIPFLDFVNHDDEAAEISGGFMGTFGTTKGAELVSTKAYKKGDEVYCSYGPKSATDYLLDHGFCPKQSWKQAVSELTLELESDDRFYDDKLDILEFETYDQAPLDPTQNFDVVSVPGRDGEPDPAMVQFARLCQLGGSDAFLLESIFRKEVWGFMALPVSEKNELQVVEWLTETISKALEDMDKCPDGGPELCARLRESETKALKRTLDFLLREKEALDLKEYYQERRLKDLGLDSDWSMEDETSSDLGLGFGQTRSPGGADYDW